MRIGHLLQVVREKTLISPVMGNILKKLNFASLTTQYVNFIGYFLFLYMCILIGVGSPQSQHGGLVLSDVCNM